MTNLIHDYHPKQYDVIDLDLQIEINQTCWLFKLCVFDLMIAMLGKI